LSYSILFSPNSRGVLGVKKFPRSARTSSWQASVLAFPGTSQSDVSMMLLPLVTTENRLEEEECTPRFWRRFHERSAGKFG